MNFRASPEFYNGGIPDIADDSIELFWQTAKSNYRSGHPNEPARLVEFNEIADELEERAKFVKWVCGGKHLPMTWQVEQALYDVGKLKVPQLPTWQQLDDDCVAVSIIAALEKLQCLEIGILGEQEEFWTGFPPWLYGTSRNQIGKGRLGEGGGSLTEWAVQAINQYGILDTVDLPLDMYNLHTVKEWGSGRWGGIWNATIPYFKYFQMAEKYNLTSIRLKTAEQVWKLREALGVWVISSPDGFEPYINVEMGRVMYKKKGQWMHQMHGTDIDEFKGRRMFKRMNQWKETHPIEQVNPMETPDGAWQFWEDFDKELSNPKVRCYGFVGLRGKELQKPNFSIFR
jgi:hypothetical protein